MVETFPDVRKESVCLRYTHLHTKALHVDKADESNSLEMLVDTNVFSSLFTVKLMLSTLFFFLTKHYKLAC